MGQNEVLSSQIILESFNLFEFSKLVKHMDSKNRPGFEFWLCPITRYVTSLKL